MTDRENEFLPYFLTMEGLTWQAIIKQNWLKMIFFYVYLLKVSSDMQQCLQFTSPMWRQHCEYFIDFWFCVWIESLSWILCPLSFFLTSPDKQRFKEYLCSYTWFYIYLNNPDEDLHMEWVCISDDVFVQTGKFYIFATWLFLSFLYVCNE